MTRPYLPSPARGVSQREWTLVMVRDLKHPPRTVWRALTEPEHLRAWAPFDADRSLAAVGPVTLTTAETPMSAVGQVRRADEPTVLELRWGDKELRWELEPLGAHGTRLTLWHDIGRSFIAMGAAGWHVCIDVLEATLDGEPLSRLVGSAALANPHWQRLHREYATLLGVKDES